MASRGRGVIVNVASAAARCHWYYYGVYSAAKAKFLGVYFECRNLCVIKSPEFWRFRDFLFLAFIFSFSFNFSLNRIYPPPPIFSISLSICPPFCVPNSPPLCAVVPAQRVPTLSSSPSALCWCPPKWPRGQRDGPPFWCRPRRPTRGMQFERLALCRTRRATRYTKFRWMDWSRGDSGLGLYTDWASSPSVPSS